MQKKKCILTLANHHGMQFPFCNIVSIGKRINSTLRSMLKFRSETMQKSFKTTSKLYRFLFVFNSMSFILTPKPMGPWDLIPWLTRSARHWASAKSLHLRCPLQSNQFSCCLAKQAPHPGSWSLLSPPRLPYPIPTFALISLPLLGFLSLKVQAYLNSDHLKHILVHAAPLSKHLFTPRREGHLTSCPAIPSFPSPRLCPYLPSY